MRSRESNESFELLAARYAHSILGRLRGDEGALEPLMTRTEPADPRNGGRATRAQPTRPLGGEPGAAEPPVEFVGGSALFSPTRDPSNWLIFVEDAIARNSGAHEFEWRHRIGAELDDAAFVEQAFSALLNRAVDASGLGNYLSLLRNGELDRRDVLRSLLSSNEVQSLGRQYLVVPEGHPWMLVVAPRFEIGGRMSRIRIAA